MGKQDTENIGTAIPTQTAHNAQPPITHRHRPAQLQWDLPAVLLLPVRANEVTLERLDGHPRRVIATEGRTHVPAIVELHENRLRETWWAPARLVYDGPHRAHRTVREPDRRPPVVIQHHTRACGHEQNAPHEHARTTHRKRTKSDPKHPKRPNNTHTTHLHRA